MVFKRSVLRWQNDVQMEIDSGGYPFPSDFILAIMQAESGGHPGLVSPAGASGLMQVMPGTLKEYNKHNKPSISLARLRSKADAAGPDQIRTGLWVIGRYIKTASNYLSSRTNTVPIGDLIKVSLVMYNAGPGATRAKMDKTDPTYAALASRYPKWSPVERYVPKVWGSLESANPVWDMDAIEKWSGTPVNPPNVAILDGTEGFLIALGMIYVAYKLMKG